MLAFNFGAITTNFPKALADQYVVNIISEACNTQSEHAHYTNVIRYDSEVAALIKSIFYKWLSPKIIQGICPKTIPRSGKDGEQIDCYILAFNKGKAPYFVATGLNDSGLVGLLWDGAKFSQDGSLRYAELENYSLKITHFYGLDTIVFDSIYDFAFHRFTKYIYFKLTVRRFIENTNQYFFNKRKLITKKRMELIQFMMEDQLDRDHDGITALDLMGKLYSLSWIVHPSADEQEKRLEIYLDSLVHSGELRRVNDEYVVTGVAISTIEKFEEEERRHVDAVKLQRKMFWLTILILIVGIIQSGIVKMPTLIDWATK